MYRVTFWVLNLKGEEVNYMTEAVDGPIGGRAVANYFLGGSTGGWACIERGEHVLDDPKRLGAIEWTRVATIS